MTGRSSNGLLERISVHDRYQIEVKRNYIPDPAKQTRYELFTYLFVPHTLGINPSTYSASNFYRDLQNYVRLRTPRLSPEEIFASERSPLVALEGWTASSKPDARVEQAVANLKLLHPVVKTTLNALKTAERTSDVTAEEYLETTKRILDLHEGCMSRLRALREPLASLGSDEVDAAYRVVDETLSLFAEQALLERHEVLEALDEGKKLKKLRARIRDFVSAEQHRRNELRAAEGAPPMKDRDFLERLSLLKKYSSQVLFLKTERKPEGKTIEHCALAAAAGVAMAFATLVTFFSQRFWQNYSIQLFLAFVCGYMFKDRIKEIARGWIASALNKRLDDHRLLLRSRDGRRQLGYIRERVRYLGPRETPREVLAKRRSSTEHGLPDASGARGEVVLLHRREVVLDPGGLAGANERVASDGLSDIARLDIRPFLAKMDDPRSKRRRFQGDRVETVEYQRTYPVYLITAVRESPDEEPAAISAVRIVLNRKGVQAVESLDAESPASPV